MPNPYEKVNPGEAFRFPAVFYNALVDLVLARLRGGPASDAPRDGTLIRILNNTGGPLDELSVVAVGNPDLTVDATTQESFLSDPVMQGNTPAAADAGRFAVLLAHAEAGGVAAAAVAGVVVVKVDEGDGGNFADVADGVTDSLVATAGGSATVLWRAAGSGKQWALVRLGGGGAAAEDSPEFYGQVHMGVANLTKGWSLLPLVNVVP